MIVTFIGLLVWIPVGMVADMHLSVDDDINDDVVHDATLHVPYSIVIAAVGGFVALVTAIMLIYLIGQVFFIVVVAPHERWHCIFLFGFGKCLWRQPYCLLGFDLLRHETRSSHGLFV